MTETLSPSTSPLYPPTAEPVGTPPPQAEPAAAPPKPRASLRDHRLVRDVLAAPVPAAVAALLFVLLFAKPMQLLARDWWNNPEAGHGLLLAPLALWLVWRDGVREDARPNVQLGLLMLVGAVLVRYMSGLAAELYTMRMSMVLALAGLTVFAYGFRQLLKWWLPFVMLWLSVPLPELVTSAMALPLQFKASQMGAALLEWRDIPVRLNGNVIQLPGNHSLFVAEACSGLRSLTSLIALSVLLGAMVLRSAVSRVFLVLVAIPIAIVINGVRVFLTGFLVFFVSPELGEGFMHTTEGWLLFLVSFVLLGAAAWVIGRGERFVHRRRHPEEEDEDLDLEVAHA
ncbi:MAG TPA: exosortase/archaeosortase family protein [Gemmatimonadaceae bacterium]|jgi:exosortase